MRFHNLYLASLLVVAPGSVLFSATSSAVEAGPLDRPSPVASAVIPGKPGVTSLVQDEVPGVDPVVLQEQLRQEVQQEQDELEKLDRAELEEKAEHGERAAQVVLGSEFAKEATKLAFAPAAANDALSDAARWYSLAASRGFPGAPSLDLAGVRFYPIRIQRELRQ